MGLPSAKLLSIEGRVVVRACERDRVVIRKEGLDDDPSGLIPPPCTPRHLRQKLECPLPGAEVGEVETQIGSDDTDERHAGDVVPLGHHLGSDEDVHLSAVERAQDPALLPLARGRVTIEPLDPRVREQEPDLLRHPFRPEAELGALRTAAARTARRGVLAEPAVVAAELADLGRRRSGRDPGRVIDERDVAVFAAGGVSTSEAVDVRRESAAVQEENGLLIPGKRLGQGVAHGA